MTVVLLCGAALLVRTVMALTSVNHGFEQRGLLTMQVSLPGTRYSIERQVAFQQELLTTIRTLPGVDSAAAASGLPVIGAPRDGTSFYRLSTPVVSGPQRPSATIRVVTPGYFRTLGIPVLRGREFTHADDANPVPGFIVNQAFVDRYLGNVDPLGESLMVSMQDEDPYAPIIGVVGNVGEGSMRGAPRPTIFYSHRQLPLGPTLFVRTDQPAATAEAVTSVIRRMDPNLAIRNVRMFEEAVAESLAQERLTALVSGAFALSGLLLASLGLYALLAFMVGERTREIGLRIALGANGGELTWSVVKDGLRLVSIGAIAGVALSLVVLPSFGTLLFGVTPTDKTTYAVVPLRSRYLRAACAPPLLPSRLSSSSLPQSSGVSLRACSIAPLTTCSIVALFISHGVSFFTNFMRRREYEGASVSGLMTAPYNRVMVMHFTLLIGGWIILLLGIPTGALVVLLALKTLLDLRAHRREHALIRAAPRQRSG